MQKTIGFLLLTLILAIVPARSHAAEPPTARRPNILFLVSEDNGRFLGCYGDKQAHTPNLDHLATQGVLYTNAFANAPVCAPSRSTLITGMYASTLGTMHMRSRYAIPPDVQLYSQLLRAAGYFCMNPGKTDYNIAGAFLETWDKGKAWSDAPAGKPWMLVLNDATTHESCLHKSTVQPNYLKEPLTLPPYHPDTPEIRSNWAEYYHDMTKMDAKMGALLNKLEKDGLADDTIVFYYSDHGGILPRSKRYVYDSGLHVPLIIRFGKNFQHLAPDKPGSKIDRLVAFVDFAPSLLSLAGAEVPARYQGRAFLGPKTAEAQPYVFGFRGRMDERIDLSYTVRDSRYRYIHNYMPHRVYGEHHDYLWKMPATSSWEAAFKAGKCDATQSAYWQPKPTEELYDEQTDFYEVKNLAQSADHQEIIHRLRGALHDQLLANRDAGFLPETDLIARAQGGPIYAMTHDAARYPLGKILEVADVASSRDEAAVPRLRAWMKDADAGVRYWAAVGCAVRGKNAEPATDALTMLCGDPSPAVRAAAGEALVRIGAAGGLDRLVNELGAPNADNLLVLDALASLGEKARPALPAILRKIKEGFPGPGRANGEQGGRYVDLAADDLLKGLAVQ